MGIETAIAAGAVGSSVIGAGMQYGENRAARKRAQQAGQQANDITSAPLDSTVNIKQAMNSGQDSFLQYLRANPTALKPFQFDASQAFQDLQAKDTQTVNDQVSALSAGAGSLGARFGSGFAAKDALLRSRFAADIGARNAGIAQSSFNTALNTGMQDFSSGRANQLQLLQMLQGGELQRRQQQLSALGFGSGLPQPGSGALVGQTGGDIASLLTLFRYLNKNNNSTPGGAQNLVPASTNYLPQIGMPT